MGEEQRNLIWLREKLKVVCVCVCVCVFSNSQSEATSNTSPEAGLPLPHVPQLPPTWLPSSYQSWPSQNPSLFSYRTCSMRTRQKVPDTRGRGHSGHWMSTPHGTQSKAPCLLTSSLLFISFPSCPSCSQQSSQQEPVQVTH